MKTLKLTIKKQWFDMILSGEKKEEYREISRYYISRLLWLHEYLEPHMTQEFIEDLQTGQMFNNYRELYDYWCCEFANYDAVKFYNGGALSKGYDHFTIECMGLEIKEGKPAWGAEKGKMYFVIKLGKLI